jgi:enoyl-CoA hydratase
MNRIAQGRPMSEVLLQGREGNVLVLTLNRPESRNAINLALAHAIAAAMDAFEADDELRVAVLTGAGKGFCSGMDLKGFSDGELPVLPGRGFAGLTQRSPAKPLIAAVEGFAVAGGCEIALACDLIVAAEDARFGLPEVKRGLVASGGGLLRMPQRIPYHVAMEMALTGESLGAHSARLHGLVNRVVPAGKALATALELARAVAANAPLAVAASKELVQKSRDWPQDRMFELQEPLARRIGESADALEGARAFVGKRAPHWSGS